MAIPPHTDRNTALLAALLCTAYALTQLTPEQLAALAGIAIPALTQALVQAAVDSWRK
ncbi:hypothetical protein [Streptomyces sp. NPDC101145]|uniref:hypothetical protein n=1 Tax=Streptomyces sp. NPDC101145 TaxID=3366112 RepID=UPI003814E276